MKDGTRATVAESDLKKLNRASLKRVVADLTLLDDMVRGMGVGVGVDVGVA